MGKGSKRRPEDFKKVQNNWESAFGKKCLKCRNNFKPEKDESFCLNCFTDG